MSHLRSESTVGEIVAHDPRTAAIFAKHRIDFCCGGARTLAAACASQGLEPAVVLADLGVLEHAGMPVDADVTAWDVNRLIEHILGRHHQYVRDQRPQIEAWLDKMVGRHGAFIPR